LYSPHIIKITISAGNLVSIEKTVCVCTISVGKAERSHFKKPKCRQKDDIKIVVKGIGCEGEGVEGFIWFGQGQVEGSCENVVYTRRRIF
jgi:hypothetical protein